MATMGRLALLGLRGGFGHTDDTHTHRARIRDVEVAILGDIPGSRLVESRGFNSGAALGGRKLSRDSADFRQCQLEMERRLKAGESIDTIIDEIHNAVEMAMDEMERTRASAERITADFYRVTHRYGQ